MKPKVSIIVPIYNMEKYLSRCLDSLLSQSLREIEIIAINDGSSDSSLSILKYYNKIDPRLKVIDKTNEGVSSARNEGLLLACGDYIGFVDPDDWVNQEMYAELYKAALNEKADIVMCSYMREFSNHSKEKNFNLPEKKKYEGLEINILLRKLFGPLEKEVANPELLDAWGTVWSKLYRADLIKSNNLTFTNLNEIGTSEDSLFNIEAFYLAKSIVFVNKPFYHYWRENSSSVTASYKPNLSTQWDNLYVRLSNFIIEKKLDMEFSVALNNRICLNTLGLGFNIISKDNLDSSISKVKKIKKILNSNRIKTSYGHFNLNSLPIHWRAFFYCAKKEFASGFFVFLVVINFLRRIVK